VENFMETPIGLLGFLSIFHIIGGIALGSTFNRIVRNRRLDGQAIFFIVWGGMFGCMPLTFGSQTESWVLFAQVGILALAIVLPFAFGGSLREGFRQPGLQNVVFGGIFLIVGMIALGFAIRLIPKDTAAFGVLAFALIFSAVGVPVFIKGLREVVEIDEEEV